MSAQGLFAALRAASAGLPASAFLRFSFVSERCMASAARTACFAPLPGISDFLQQQGTGTVERLRAASTAVSNYLSVERACNVARLTALMRPATERC
jgi:hypothetical protein